MNVCCEKYKDGNIHGEKINFCPICGKSLCFKTNRYPAVLNGYDTFHLFTRPLDVSIKEEYEFLLNIAWGCQIAEQRFKHRDIHERHIEKFIKKLAESGEWNYISGYMCERR